MSDKPFGQLRRILAIRLDNIGDVIMLGPALRALHQAYPRADITLMASPAGSQVAPLLPWVNDVITWRASWQDIVKDAPVDIEKEQELVRLLRERSFDAAFIFTSFSQSPYPPAYACTLAEIPQRIGQSKEFGGALLTHWVKPAPDHSYQVDRNLHLLRSVGIPADSNRLELRIGEEDRRSTDALLLQAGIQPGTPFFALAPGASAKARRYDEARLADAARHIIAEIKLPIVLLGSQREVGRFSRLEALAAEEIGVHSLIGQTTLAQMAAVIQSADVVLTNNSSALHMSAAFQRPMVVLYSGTELFEQWLPPYARARILHQATGCSPCYRFDCPYHMECLDIPAEDVAEAAISLLRTYNPIPNPQAGD
jgi:lipopolysaccharide heptosyltransferase II